MNIDRLSIGATEGVHDVQYTPDGAAYCGTKTHQWKTGEQWWPERASKGYITFGDRHLGMAVTHKVEVRPGESYVMFWTRIHAAKRTGVINTIGTSAYSEKDINILQGEVPGIDIKQLVTDPSAYKGMTEAEGKAWRDRENKTFNDGLGSEKAGLKLGLGGIGLLFILAIGYLLLRGWKK